MEFSNEIIGEILKYMKYIDILKIHNGNKFLDNEIIRLIKGRKTYKIDSIQDLINWNGFDVPLYETTNELSYSAYGKDKKFYLNIKTLFLMFIDVKNLLNNIGILQSLEVLILDHNNIKILPREIGNLIPLKELELSFNEIEHIPEEIKNLINLKELNLENNKIRDIRKEIRNLSNLQILSISNNLISNLPDEIANLINLEIFIANNNQIESSENLIKNLSILSNSNLFLVDLKNNKIDNLDIFLQKIRIKNDKKLPPEMTMLSAKSIFAFSML